MIRLDKILVFLGLAILLVDKLFFPMGPNWIDWTAILILVVASIIGYKNQDDPDKRKLFIQYVIAAFVGISIIVLYIAARSNG
jgi:hypothetical protein